VLKQQGEARNDYPERRNGIITHMATIHISATEAARNFTALLAQVRAGAEVIIEDGQLTVAVLHAAAQPRRSIEGCIALLREDSPATIDEDFARDVAQAVTAHRKPLNPSARN
jgi:antitoxin (DNA-binding transcriptional repressor) of toxin-antitoxin stability system